MSLEYQIELSDPSSPIQPPLILRIPCQHIFKQTTNVEAWLLYLGFCVCGVTGSLHTSDGTTARPTLTITNLLQSVEQDVTCRYTPSGSVNIVDPSAWSDRKFARSSAARSSTFSQGCKDRDGGCVLQNTFLPSDSKLPDWERAKVKEGAMRSCQAIHLLPHSRGNIYMDLVSKARAPNPHDYIHEIDDIRNGLTMLVHLSSDLMPDYCAAFLHVPNEYMTVEDAVLHDLDNAGARAQDEVHCHIVVDRVHYSPNVINAVSAGALWDNKCLRQSKDRSLWPPPYLWDFIFGAAAVKNWATPETLPAFVKMADEKYNVHGAYRNSSDDDGDASDDTDDDGIVTETEEGGVMFNGYDVWDLVACIVPAHRVPSQQEDAHEKVAQWLNTDINS